MTDVCTVIRESKCMAQCYDVLRQLKEQYRQVGLSDTGRWTNPNLIFKPTMSDMLIYVEAILAAVIERTELRNSHFRPNCSHRDDDHSFKITFAMCDAMNDRPVFTYKPVPTPLVLPRARTYGHVDEASTPGSQPKSPSAATT